MEFTKIDKPQVGDVVSKPGFVDKVIDNLNYLNDNLDATRLNVLNASFENTLKDEGTPFTERPTNWSSIPENALSVVSDVHHHGGRALRVEAGATAFSSIFEVPADQTIVVRLAVKGAAGAYAIKLAFFGGGGISEPITPTTNLPYTLSEYGFQVMGPLTAEVPMNARYARLELIVPSPLYFDWVSVYVAEHLVVQNVLLIGEGPDGSHAARRQYVDDQTAAAEAYADAAIARRHIVSGTSFGTSVNPLSWTMLKWHAVRVGPGETVKVRRMIGALGGLGDLELQVYDAINVVTIKCTAMTQVGTCDQAMNETLRINAGASEEIFSFFVIAYNNHPTEARTLFGGGGHMIELTIE
jgi:hypothetical protein